MKAADAGNVRQPVRDNVRTKMSWKEQREKETLEQELEALEAEKSKLEEELSSGSAGFERCRELSERYAVVKDLIDEKETRWLTLSV